MAAKLTMVCRQMVLDVAISSLHDEFVWIHGRHPEGEELPDFLSSFGSNRLAICEVLNDRNTELPWLLSSQLDAYPNFWVDLHRNIQYEKLPRNKRPPREAS